MLRYCNSSCTSSHMMLRYCNSSCTSSHIWCYAAAIRLALLHIYEATLLEFVLALLHIYDCYAAVIRLALPHIYDAHHWCSIRAQLTLFGGWSKDPCLRIFIRRVLGIQPCSMARFGRMFALGSGDGKTVPTKTCPSSLHRLSRTLSAENKRVPLRFFTFPVKSTRVLFKEIALSGKCKNTVICGIKSMSNTANVENAGSINNPPGCFW